MKRKVALRDGGNVSADKFLNSPQQSQVTLRGEGQAGVMNQLSKKGGLLTRFTLSVRIRSKPPYTIKDYRY